MLTTNSFIDQETREYVIGGFDNKINENNIYADLQMNITLLKKNYQFLTLFKIQMGIVTEMENDMASSTNMVFGVVPILVRIAHSLIMYFTMMDESDDAMV